MRNRETGRAATAVMCRQNELVF